MKRYAKLRSYRPTKKKLFNKTYFTTKHTNNRGKLVNRRNLVLAAFDIRKKPTTQYNYYVGLWSVPKQNTTHTHTLRGPITSRYFSKLVVPWISGMTEEKIISGHERFRRYYGATSKKLRCGSEGSWPADVTKFGSPPPPTFLFRFSIHRLTRAFLLRRQCPLPTNKPIHSYLLGRNRTTGKSYVFNG